MYDPFNMKVFMELILTPPCSTVLGIALAGWVGFQLLMCFIDLVPPDETDFDPPPPLD